MRMQEVPSHQGHRLAINVDAVLYVKGAGTQTVVVFHPDRELIVDLPMGTLLSLLTRDDA